MKDSDVTRALDLKPGEVYLVKMKFFSRLVRTLAKSMNYDWVTVLTEVGIIFNEEPEHVFKMLDHSTQEMIRKQLATNIR